MGIISSLEVTLHTKNQEKQEVIKKKTKNKNKPEDAAEGHMKEAKMSCQVIEEDAKANHKQIT